MLLALRSKHYHMHHRRAQSDSPKECHSISKCDDNGEWLQTMDYVQLKYKIYYALET